MPITTTHPEYQAAAPKWERCRDTAAGSDAVKAAGTKYLPRPTGMDPRDYRDYLTLPLFYNAMGRTIAGLAGAIVQKAPHVTVGPYIEAMLSDITLADQSLELLAGMVIWEVLTVGRTGVLVDWSTDSNRPFMATYCAESIVSWRTERRGGNQRLVRLVLREYVEEPDESDESKINGVGQYRELVLTPEGEYWARVHARLPRSHLRDASREMWVATDWMKPVRRSQALPFIPFVIFGATGLGARVERPPLLDLADVNISHYQSSAYRETCLSYTAQPTPWVAGAAVGEGPLKIGSRTAWVLGEGGQCGMLEHSGQGIGAIKDAMQEKVQLMASLGARLLEQQPSAAETATAVGMRHSGEHATLRAIAQTVEAGLTMALQWFAWWDGTVATPKETKASVELSKDFFALRMTADELRACVLAWQADGMSWDTLHYNLTRGGLARPGVSAAEERKTIQHEGGMRPPATNEGNAA